MIDLAKLRVLATDLPHRVAAQSASEVTSSLGQRVKTWTTIGTYWASVEPISHKGRERERALAIRSDASHFVYLRYGAPLTTQMRLLFRGRALNIVSIQNLGERNIILELLCTEVAGGA